MPPHTHASWKSQEMSPVVGWVPLKVEVQKSPEKGISSEKHLSPEKLVEELRVKGWVELKAPPQIPPVRLFATCRTIQNPDCPDGTITPTHQVALGGRYGFSEGYVIDLVAEVPEGSGIYTPVGHRDVKIVRYPGVPEATWANGNFAISRNLTEEWGKTVLPAHLGKILRTADEIWGMNGVDVIGGKGDQGHEAGYDQAILEQFYRTQGLPPDLSWRRKGLGKLLIGLELELLRQRGVRKLELQSVSDELRGIFNRITDSERCVFIEQMPSSEVQALINPFLL